MVGLCACHIWTGSRLERERERAREEEEEAAKPIPVLPGPTLNILLRRVCFPKIIIV